MDAKITTRPDIKYIVHVNAFSAKVEGGYLMINGRKSGPTLTRAKVLAAILDDADARCEFLKV